MVEACEHGNLLIPSGSTSASIRGSARRTGGYDHRIIRTAGAADKRLDAQVEAFDKVRGLEAKAPEHIAGLGGRLDSVTARLPEGRRRSRSRSETKLT
ncbi:hypothetical protein [Pseudonocardia alaniniphila]|uniref:Uncharacterized protein n=1 Tax=Pseudonocardia alaniniphila TaxID=75291 RepID=A0ABS9TMW4_9PSEU|nr:hypothetical protein [Pseudonocardia alaniniphila]MCH6169877.1 hypothetical protein [Pseudonocardia alaniniphila]